MMMRRLPQLLEASKRCVSRLATPKLTPRSSTRGSRRTRTRTSK